MTDGVATDNCTLKPTIATHRDHLHQVLFSPSLLEVSKSNISPISLQWYFIVIVQIYINISFLDHVVKCNLLCVEIPHIRYSRDSVKGHVHIVRCYVMRFHHDSTNRSNLSHIHSNGSQKYDPHGIRIELSTFTHVKQHLERLTPKCFFMQKRVHW